MNYLWSEFEKDFNLFNLKPINIEFDILNEAEALFSFNGVTKTGANGKTCWYFPLNTEESKRIINTDKKIGLKIIKYPVFNDIIDEYRRLLQEFSIQKILYKNNMAPDIFKLVLVKNHKHIKVKFSWLNHVINYPCGSVFFAQIVEHVDERIDSFRHGININSEGIIYGKLINNFVKDCLKLRITPYDINVENMFIKNKKLCVVDVHKWKRSYNIIPPPVPEYLQIELSNICNAKCKMCNIPYMTRKKGYMTDDLFIKILSEANELGVSHITPFLHGEPFIRDDFVEKLILINKIAPRANITLFTNASLLHEEVLYKMNSIKNFEQIVFSFPGGNKETYEKVTGLNFETSVKNIKNAFRILKDVNMRISMPKFEGNISSEKDFFELWDEYPCSSYKTYNYLGNISGTLSEACFEHCDRAFRSMTILYDGRICLCCMDSNGDYIMGDINKEHMLAIWNNKKYRTLRELHGICRMAYTPCNRCTLDLKTKEYESCNFS